MSSALGDWICVGFFATTPGHGVLALHTIADGLIAAAYVILAIALWRLARSGRMVFPGLFALFGAFLLAGALAHGIAAVTFGESGFGTAGGAKLLAAAVAIAAAAAMMRAVPAVLQLPTRAELAARIENRAADLTAANEQRRREAGQREEAEAEIRRLNVELKSRLAELSARKQAEEQRLDFERKLLQSQKLESIGLLAGGIAHDFNNLLTGVLGHANFARGELARGSTDIDPLLAQVEQSAQRAAELCRQLLAYAGKGRLVVRLIDLNVAVEQAVPLLKLSITKKASLELQLGSGLPPFRGDPTQMSQVLMNLVINAAEAIGAANGVVTIRTERVNLTPMDMLTLDTSHEVEPGQFVCLEVRDTGCGIAPEAIAHIFEPFFTTKFVGRGLGLAAVQGIVHGHRGAIRVSSQVGIGSTFELFFPVVAAPSRNTSPGLAVAAAPRSSVLVVDDDETVRNFAGTVLISAGYAVTTATDGEDALAKLRSDPLQFDAVLLDLAMPKLDGEDTLMALRMLAPTLPVVLTSGHSAQLVAQRFVGRGVADFLPKPFLGETLVSVIAAALTRARARDHEEPATA